ncbi:MAG: metallophosphoesterase [Balneolales bacterium]|nr:metallophosphoesterase [Balneolales bacterium]
MSTFSRLVMSFAVVLCIGAGSSLANVIVSVDVKADANSGVNVDVSVDASSDVSVDVGAGAFVDANVDVSADVSAGAFVEANVDPDGLLRFTLIHSNDEHAALVPSPQSEYGFDGAQTTGGIARVATIIKTIREQKAAQNEQVLVVSAGDFISGSPFSWLVLRDQAPEIDLMIAAGYDVLTLGNHEFDYGPERLASYLHLAGYPEKHDEVPIVASNTVIPAGHPLGETGLLPWRIINLDNGLNVGFFGLMGKDADSVAPGAAPITFADQHEIAAKMVQALKENGADVIVLLSHSGEREEAELARAVSGIDVIVGGHTHAVLIEPIRVNNTLIVQTGTEYQYLGKLELAYNPANNEVMLRNAPVENGSSYLIPVDDSVEADRGVAQLLAVYEEELNELIGFMTHGNVTDYRDKIAFSDFVVPREPSLSETPLGNFVADAMRYQGAIATGKAVDGAFQASGVIRGDLIPGQVGENKGAITFFDFVKVIGLGTGPDELPGYPMVSVYLTGTEIRRITEITILLSELMGPNNYLQSSGVNWVYSTDRMLWLTVPFMNIPIPSGKAVSDAWIYRGDGFSVQPPSHAVAAGFTPLEKDDDTLYHFISDYYVVQFLPMVGEVVPQLKLELKDENGDPITNLDDRIVYKNGQEYKVWQAVTDFLMNQPVGESGLPTIDARYSDIEDRIVSTSARSLLFWPVIILIGILIAVIGFWRYRKSR